MSEKYRVTLRLDETLLEAIKAKAGEASLSDLIRTTLEEKFVDERVEPKPVTAKATNISRGMTRYDFVLPVGDVICFGEDKPQIQLWWVSETEMHKVKTACETWEKNGFQLVIGSKGKGTYTVPEEIEYEVQERKRGGNFSVGCRGQEARIGDKLVWLEITDSVRALDWMKEHTDVPVAVRADLIRYSTDATYRAAVERAEECFVTYAVRGTPLGVEEEEDV